MEWALSAEQLANSPIVATDSRRPPAGRINKRIHRVEIASVAGGSTVHYQIVSGGVPDENGPYTVTKLAAALSSAPRGLTGSVTLEDGSSVVECLVYVRITENFFGLGTIIVPSLWVSTLTGEGFYVIDVGNMRDSTDINSQLNYGANSPSATITVTAVCDGQRSGTITRTTGRADKLIVAGSVAEYQNLDVVIGVHPPVYFCNGAPATIVGTNGPDILIGTRGPDVIVGLGGNDVIRAQGGDDVVCAGPGHDVVMGGSGYDWISGGGGADTLRGGTGRDCIHGRSGDDTIVGGRGRDRLFGNLGDDTIDGRRGPDRLVGGQGDDVLIGRLGDDSFKCGAGADTADGGLGMDAADADCEAQVRIP